MACESVAVTFSPPAPPRLAFRAHHAASAASAGQTSRDCQQHDEGFISVGIPHLYHEHGRGPAKRRGLLVMVQHQRDRTQVGLGLYLPQNVAEAVGEPGSPEPLDEEFDAPPTPLGNTTSFTLTRNRP